MLNYIFQTSNKLLLGLCVISLTALVLITVIDVLGRYLLSLPLPGTTEITEIILGALIFGGITILQLHAQGFDIRISAQYLSMLPYLATIIILVSLRMRAKNKTNRTMPNCLGRIFHSTT